MCMKTFVFNARIEYNRGQYIGAVVRFYTDKLPFLITTEVESLVPHPPTTFSGQSQSVRLALKTSPSGHS